MAETTASNVDPDKSPQQAHTQPTAATPTEPQKETGHIPQGSQSSAVAGRQVEAKAQNSALLKPDVARTYEELPPDPITPKGGIVGLADIPRGWPSLPSNVSLSSEIAWVQAERLRVVKDKGNLVRVDLSRARSPAPSMAAISWLETSIRSYAKFIEVASKTATAGNDEAEFVRQERMRIGEIRALLGEMKDAGKVD